MTDFTWLSTKTQKHCSHCREELVLIDPTDVLASRPADVALICPCCGCQTKAKLTMEQLFPSIYPQLLRVSLEIDASNDNALIAATRSRRPSDPPPPGDLLH